MKSVNLLIVISSVMVSMVTAANECMYCKAMDTNAGFLYSWSYCESTGKCVQDQWDKMNAWCDSKNGWTRGYKLNLVEDLENPNTPNCGGEKKTF